MRKFVGMDPGAVRRLASALRDTGLLAAQLKPILAESIGFLSGELPFPSMDAAKQAGIVAGGEGKRLWEAWRRDPSGSNRLALTRWLRGLGATKTRDHAYASALLRTLGRENFIVLITERTTGGGGKPGLCKGELEGVRSELGPIAEALASAEAAGELPADIRDTVLNGLPDAGLSALLALADQPTTLLVPAARSLIPAGHGKDPNWNTHWMVSALARNRDAMREVVSNRHDLALLLHPQVTKHIGTPGFEAQLAKAIDGVTAPGMGRPEERQQIFINAMNLLGTDEYKQTLSAGSPLNAVLAKNSGQYFPQLAGIAAAAANEEDATFHPGAPWDLVSAQTARQFMARLAATATTLALATSLTACNGTPEAKATPTPRASTLAGATQVLSTDGQTIIRGIKLEPDKIDDRTSVDDTRGCPPGTARRRYTLTYEAMIRGDIRSDFAGAPPRDRGP
ncbi:MAG: hypothetical protein GEV11_01635 [Streptosporangiales bacterium]|nr:hypothetical protein [Streptosporangiales bacterium]